MIALPVPDILTKSIYELTPELFRGRGIRFLLLDVDNTLAPYTTDTASERLKAWVRELRGAGLELFILSNNKGDRPRVFAEALGLPYRKRARKPFPRAAREVLRETGHSPAESALVGDQIYTDTLCARCCGMLAVTVEPIRFSNFWLRLRYWTEAPFRAAGRIKSLRHTVHSKEKDTNDPN